MAVLWSCSPYNIKGVNINDLRKCSLKLLSQPSSNLNDKKERVIMSDCCEVQIIERIEIPLCSECLEHCVIINDEPTEEEWLVSQVTREW